MAIRNDSFRVVFEVQNDGTIKAAFDGVARQAEQAGQAVDESGQKWYELGQKIGTSLRWAGGIAAAGLALIVHNTIKAEQELAQLDAILRSTGNAAGYTRAQLVQMADEMAGRSVFSSGDIIEAQTRLLSYSGILGENIPRAMQAVIDQSARLGISVTQSAETIGRALESPSKAAAALAQQGFGAAFTKEVRGTIDALVDAGREAEAQVMILEILEESYGGAAQAARDTFGGALIALKNTLADLMTGGDGTLDGATQAVNDLIDTLTDPRVRQGFADMTAGALQAAAGFVSLAADLRDAIGVAQEWLNLQLGGNRSMGGEHLAEQRRELELLQREAQSREGRVSVLGHPLWNPDSVGGSIGGLSDSALDRRISKLKETIDLNEMLFGDPNSPQNRVRWIDPSVAGTMTEDRHLAAPGSGQPRPTGGGGGGGGRRGMSDAEREAQALARAYESYNLQLLRSNELFEDNSALARLNFEIQYGSLKGLDPVLADHLRMQAESLDILEDVAEHERIVNQIRQEHEETIRHQNEAYEELIDSLMLELEVMGMSRSAAAAMIAIRRLGIDTTSEEAQKIRDLYAQIEDNERVISAMDAVRSAGSGLLVDLAKAKDPFEAALNALDRLNEKLLQMVADQLIEQLFGSFGSTGAGSSGGGWLGAIFGSMFGGGGGAGGGMAYGGETRPNMLHEINELGGPEIFRTRNGRQYLLTGSEHGEVMPLQGAGGAGGDTYNINVPADGIMDYRSRRQYAGDLSKELALSRRNR